jgi:adenylylsulfate kinase-like enzyme/SAM-dependent methyltransferase
MTQNLSDPVNNGVIWITGFSGAGKTTVAEEVTKLVRKSGKFCLLLDGDDLRSILGDQYSYAPEDRKKLARVYGRLAKYLAQGNCHVVIATVAMFESIRTENRKSIQNYFEVYLKVPESERVARDSKGIYSYLVSTNSQLNNKFEEPVLPDLVLENYGSVTPELAANSIVDTYFKYLVEQDQRHLFFAEGNEEIAEQSTYWNKYYKSRLAPMGPSPFAIFCNENWIHPESTILEFGCGNGRDAFFFARSHNVYAIDKSIEAIDANTLRSQDENLHQIQFKSGAFGERETFEESSCDVVYARFVLHSMTKDEADVALKASFSALKPGGRIMLEFRTNKDPLFGSGQAISEDERITDHYRRFIDLASFTNQLESFGFTLLYQVESNGLAIHADEDPVVARVVAEK